MSCHNHDIVVRSQKDVGFNPAVCLRWSGVSINNLSVPVINNNIVLIL